MNTTGSSKGLIKELSKLSTPDVCFAMGNTGALGHHIRPVFKRAKLCGPAVTVRTGPGDNLFCHKVIEYIRKGDVVVVSTLGEDAAVWGEFTSLSAKMQGAVGAVIDGAVTDVLEIEKMGFPVFAKSITPRTTFREGYGEVNIRIVCGGVAVGPGDLILGDENGVVVVPSTDLKRVIANAKEKASFEEKARKEILGGKMLPELSRVDDILHQKRLRSRER